MQEMNDLIQNIGYSFKNPELLEEALTHPSCKSEGDNIRHNQRLEFLGDAVLGLVIGEELFCRHPDYNEGQLTSARSLLVRESSISKIARELGFGKALRMSRGESRNGGSENPSILADTFEAVLGAIYLDGGLAPAREFCLRLLAPINDLPDDIDAGRGVSFFPDSKTLLQEWTQANYRITPSYRIVNEKGPPHRPVFIAEVWCGGKLLASGSGNTKKEAHKDAARNALISHKDGV